MYCFLQQDRFFQGFESDDQFPKLHWSAKLGKFAASDNFVWQCQLAFFLLHMLRLNPGNTGLLVLQQFYLQPEVP